MCTSRAVLEAVATTRHLVTVVSRRPCVASDCPPSPLDCTHMLQKRVGGIGAGVMVFACVALACQCLCLAVLSSADMAQFGGFTGGSSSSQTAVAVLSCGVIPCYIAMAVQRYRVHDRAFDDRGKDMYQPLVPGAVAPALAVTLTPPRLHDGVAVVHGGLWFALFITVCVAASTASSASYSTVALTVTIQTLLCGAIAHVAMARVR